MELKKKNLPQVNPLPLLIFKFLEIEGAQQ